MSLDSELLRANVPEPLMELAASVAEALGPGIDIFCDQWSILDWMERPGNLDRLTLRFDRFMNTDLRIVAKIYIGSKRVQERTSNAGAFSILEALIRLDKVIRNKSISELNNQDFLDVEKSFKDRGKLGKVSSLSNLQAFSKWLLKRLCLRLSYEAPKGRPAYGRHGSESGRQKKMLPTEVIRDLFGLASNPDLSLRDRFFVNALVINTAIGGRINELACLPLDCLVKQEDKWLIKLFPEKGGRLFFRPFPQEMYPAVKAAVDFIIEHTNEGRDIARKLRLIPGIDWRKVTRSHESFRYFVSKFASDWTKNNSLFTPKGCYFFTSGIFVDAKKLLERFKKASKAAAYLGTTTRVFNKLMRCQEMMSEKVYLYGKSSNDLAPLTCDVPNWSRKLRVHPHALSANLMERFAEVHISAPWMREIVREVFDEALAYQLQDKVYPFVSDPRYENNFVRKILPIVRKDAATLLEPEDSLFIIPRNLLSYSTVRTNEFSMVSERVFQAWRNDASRAEGSLFRRYNILDPRTGSVIDFVWHDIRHWLNTVYKQGGLSDAQVNLILGRKDLAQGQVYDHTPALSRSLILQNMMRRIREDKAVGTIQTTFNKLKIENRKTAEEYLTAAVRVINPMPHGGCAHNLALKPCQNHLSCLATGKDGKPCEELVVDTEDNAQRLEIKRLAHDALLMMRHIANAGGGASPQYEHFDNIQKSAAFLLAEASTKT